MKKALIILAFLFSFAVDADVAKKRFYLVVDISPFQSKPGVL